jgi:hypothetical protein
MATALINLVDAFKYYKGQPGQVEAAEFLNKNLTDAQKSAFQELYRKAPPPPPPAPKNPPYIYVKWSGEYDGYGLKVFGMYLIGSEGEPVDKLAVCSGQAYAQDVVQPLDDYSGSMRPCPEGIYDLGAIDDIGYDPGSGDGFGRYVIPLNPRAAIQRSALLLHADRNRGTSPGSAGCLCPYKPENMDKLVSWVRQKSGPKFLVVDHGLGFLKQEGFVAPNVGK